MGMINTRIVLRNDSSAEWLVNSSKVLLKGEVGIEFLPDEKVKIKIGDGVKTWEQLDYFGDFNGDNLTVLVENGIIKLKGFDEAAVGSQLVKGADGTMSWVLPDTSTVEGLQTVVGTLQNDVTKVQDEVKSLTEVVEEKANAADVYTKTEVDSKLSSVYRFQGTVENFSDLPTEGLTVGDVYNVVNAGEGIKAGDNVAWNGEGWDVLSGTVDLSGYATKAELETVKSAVDEIAETYVTKEEALASLKTAPYEVCYEPVATQVSYRDKEIRIMCPTDTEWKLQNVGAGGDSTKYYIGLKAYAPNDSVTGFKEDLAETISDETIYSFENNEFAGIDEYGRKYSIVWLPVAAYDAGSGTGEWTYYGAGSSAQKYIGWYYSVEWYEGGVKVASDTIRINLSNEECHNSIEPYYMGKVIKGVSVGGTLLDVVNNQVEIALAGAEQAGVVKSAEGENKVTVEADGTMTVKSINVSALVQNEDDVLILNGGSSAI